jgi:hypothetical protein
VEGKAISQLRLRQAQKLEELKAAGQSLAGELAAKKALHKSFRGILLQLQAKVCHQRDNALHKS